MKKLFICLTLIICAGNLISQINLVQNPGFEIINNCPTTSFFSGDIPPWDSPSDGSPDSYDSCAFQVPNNLYAYQLSHTGHGFVGAAFFADVTFREYIQVVLDNALIANKKYCASFYVNLSNVSKKATNNIGIYFSATHTYVPTTNYLSFIPQINNIGLVSDTANWTLISGDFIAQGGEKYIIIGNFYPDSVCDTINLSGTLNAGYYFVDDVDVHYCDPDGVVELGMRNEELGIYPNPANLTLTLSTRERIKEVRIYNVLGEEILSFDKLRMTQERSSTIDVSHYPNGIYFIEVQTPEGLLRRKFIKE